MRGPELERRKKKRSEALTFESVEELREKAKKR